MAWHPITLRRKEPYEKVWSQSGDAVRPHLSSGIRRMNVLKDWLGP